MVWFGGHETGPNPAIKKHTFRLLPCTPTWNSFQFTVGACAVPSATDAVEQQIHQHGKQLGEANGKSKLATRQLALRPSLVSSSSSVNEDVSKNNNTWSTAAK